MLSKKKSNILTEILDSGYVLLESEFFSQIKTDVYFFTKETKWTFFFSFISNFINSMANGSIIGREVKWFNTVEKERTLDWEDPNIYLTLLLEYYFWMSGLTADSYMLRF